MAWAQACKLVFDYGAIQPDYWYIEVACTSLLTTGGTQHDYEENTGHNIVEPIKDSKIFGSNPPSRGLSGQSRAIRLVQRCGGCGSQSEHDRVRR